MPPPDCPRRALDRDSRPCPPNTGALGREHVFQPIHGLSFPGAHLVWAQGVLGRDGPHSKTSTYRLNGDRFLEFRCECSPFPSHTSCLPLPISRDGRPAQGRVACRIPFACPSGRPRRRPPGWDRLPVRIIVSQAACETRFHAFEYRRITAKYLEKVMMLSRIRFSYGWKILYVFVITYKVFNPV